jgi:5'-phosphate synthase pdxT subunit
MNIGIFAVQGDFEAHATMLQRLSVPYTFVTKPSQLRSIDGLILPGGESTTMLKFLTEENFLEPIQDFAKTNCLLGTCAGAILLANKVMNPSQYSLALIDVLIERNAYGRQLASHIVWGDFGSQKIEMVFIRAPRILEIGPEVEVFATYEGEPVGVSQGNFMLTTFHPELTENPQVHQHFISQCKLNKKGPHPTP